MPPKGWKKYADGFRPATSSGLPAEKRPEYGIDDLLLPRSTIAKLVRECLPAGTALPRDVVTALMHAATVFISFLCADANSICQSQGHKIVTPANIEAALERCGFGAFIAPVREMTERTVARVAAAKEQRQLLAEQSGNQVGTGAGALDSEEEMAAAGYHEELISSDSEPEDKTIDLSKRARID